MTPTEQDKIRRHLNAPHKSSSRVKSSHVINTDISYSELSNVRKFLRQFARPSTLSDLIDSTDTSPVWHDLVIRVYVEVTGEPSIYTP